MSNFFKDLKLSFNRGVTKACIKTGAACKKSTIKSYISALDAEVKEIYASIGEDAYVSWTNGINDMRPFEEKFRAAYQKLNDIEQMKVDIIAIDESDDRILNAYYLTKTSQIAALPQNAAGEDPEAVEAGSVQAAEAAPQAAEPVAEASAGAPVQPQMDGKICAACGTKNNITSKFCKSCGRPL